MSRRIACAALAALLAGSAPARAAESVATALIVSVDVSQSVDDARFTLQMEGIAEALEDPGVLAAITGNAGGILFAMVTWADRAGMPVPWRRITNKAEAAAAAAAVRATPRQAGEFTCIGQMFRTVAASVIPAMPMPADRIVVDVSGDGIDNCTDPDAMEAERRDVLALGATINGLPILVPGENDVVGAGAYRAPATACARPRCRRTGRASNNGTAPTWSAGRPRSSWRRRATAISRAPCGASSSSRSARWRPPEGPSQEPDGEPRHEDHGEQAASSARM